ncbi:hypothetical protein GWO43_27380 [candidate division KSB1 bacterium]|nr:hypothetical protein [candidate division KSB1 bacterium]NIR70506.1 hypothetical protein [candidate division KSB1 bacterium]NIS27681.1 hypothetical protein [candidate division KSB1 bacterium]NIT74516.1 hypothetical protein [candidate division KSB1 bacterium]NIU23755.1 hypothetical protein [candidate division KSB1 bacterium]
MFQQIQSIYDQTYEVLSTVLDLSWKILPLVVIILLLAYVYDALKNNRGNYTDFLFRVGVAVLAMVSYKWWSVEIATLIVEIAKLFKTDGISDYYNVVIELFESHAGNEARWFEVGLQFRGFLYYSLLWLSVALVALASVFFEMLQFWAQAFLWVLGPIAIVLTLFPNFRGAFVNWLNRFIAVGFWSVLYTVTTRIFNGLIGETFSNLWVENKTGIDVTGQGFSIMKLVLFSVAFFFAIIRIPAMTGWFTRHSFASISYIIGAGAAIGASKLMSFSGNVAARLGRAGGGQVASMGSAIARKLGRS